MKSARASFLSEFVLLLAAAGCFLGAYIGATQSDPGVVAAHIPIVLGLWAAPLGLRLLAWHFLPAERAARMVVSVAIALPAIAIATWYLLILVGIDAWGRVVTWPIASAYAPDFLELAATLGYPQWMTILACAAAFIAPLAIVFFLFSPYDWMRAFSQTRTTAGAIAISIFLLAIPCALSARIFILGGGHPEEPFSLSFSPSAGKSLQSHVLPASTRLDAAEQAERSRLAAGSRRSRPNVVLIVGDALRADHMSLHGYDRRTTPRIERLLETNGGYVVPRARSVCAESLCGLLGLATSRPIHLMPSKPISMSEVLRLNGYAVHMIP